LAAEIDNRCTLKQGAHIKGLRDQPYGLRDFIIADPDGNRIDVGQPILNPPEDQVSP
jgi:hypothetical protein